MTKPTKAPPDIDRVVDEIKRDQTSGNMRKAWDKKTKPAAILLDWDYFLVNSQDFNNAVGAHVIKQMSDIHGLATPDKDFKSKGWQKASEYYWQVYGPMALKAMRIHKKYLLETEMLPELKNAAVDLLKLLENSDVPYAIVSDAGQDVLERIVTRTLNAHNLFVPVVVGTSSEIVGKPEPDSILRALAILSTQTGKCLMPDNDNIVMIGDRADKDGAAATNAGISHLIIPSQKKMSTDGWKTLPDLESLVNEMEQALNPLRH